MSRHAPISERDLLREKARLAFKLFLLIAVVVAAYAHAQHRDEADERAARDYCSAQQAGK